MKRIGINDPERARKRRDKIQQNKLKKRNPDRKVLKPLYNEHYKGDVNNIINGPFYDPYEQHVHVWKNSSIQSEENPRDKYFNKIKKPFTGKHCSVCHFVPKHFTMGYPGPDRINNHEQILKDAIMEYNEENKKTVSLTETFDNLDLEDKTPSEIEKFNIIRYSFEELFISGTECQFFVPGMNGLSHGVIQQVGETIGVGKYKMLSIRDDNGRLYNDVNSAKVIPFYYNIVKSAKNSPVDIPPKIVQKGNVDYMVRGAKKSVTHATVWSQKWNNFVEWKSFMNFLKNHLPTVCGNYQTIEDCDMVGAYIRNKYNKPIEKSIVSKFSEKIKNMTYEQKCKAYPFLVFRQRKRNNTYFKVIDDEAELSKELKKLDIEFPMNKAIKRRKVIAM